MSGSTGGKNKFLMGVHIVITLLYVAFAGFILSIQMNGDALLAVFGLCSIPISIHAFGAMGAYRGKAWGRRLSKIIGWLMVFGFPIGTIFGAMILSQLGDEWEASV